MPVADTTAVRFQTRWNDGSTHSLVGILYTAAADGPAPAAVFLHGFPGSEKNHDLAHHLRANGWHVLVVHFSGCWGSSGPYRVSQQVTDARHALDYLLSDECPAQVNPRKVALLGYSIGSRTALMTALEDERAGAVISIGGFADFAEVMFDREFFTYALPFLNGTTPDELARDYRELGKGIQPYEAVPRLAPRPVLVVHGDADEVVPLYNAAALQGPNVSRLMIPNGNHSFGGQRADLINGVHRFLAKWHSMI